MVVFMVGRGFGWIVLLVLGFWGGCIYMRTKAEGRYWINSGVIFRRWDY